ncbi:hypothetical protein N8J89_40075 [Crossiella sp. CA-258035]|uniref:tetratricopeptide repeat protein n=1 Tax=Crossiella sp. CA-258035 TaxID=2981138 RepID=UPI0024BD13B0|nr:tetratricopeptide repeat protein [Crossiella sp. CA-258035]WHT19219.1 hypothetical protein N8J89_40075 [Crossiella sp. CA-258035]
MAEVSNELSGVVHGNVTQAQSLYLTAGTPEALAGLPPVPADFTGRARELTEVLDCFGQGLPVVIHGVGGAGKTSLALHAAHQVEFTAKLFVDLQGYRQFPVEPQDALSVLLTALGASPPPEQAAAEALYRSKLAGHPGRVLVLLDNTSSAAQLRPLLPSRGPHQVLVTSRHSLGGLGAAHRVRLGPLSRPEATAFLALSRPGDPGVHELAEQCGRLPLALRIASAVLADDPDRPLHTLTSALADRGGRLDELSYDESLDVRTAFDLSYERLTEEEAWLFRLLSQHPGTEFGSRSAAALAALSEQRTQRLLDRLLRANMISVGERWGRYRFHDLVLLYAQEHAGREPGFAELKPRLRHRLIDYYHAAGRAESEWLRPEAGQGPERIAGRVAALRWFDLEHRTMIELIRRAWQAGHYDAVLALGVPVADYLVLRRNLLGQHALLDLMLAALQAGGGGDPVAEGEIRLRLGMAHRMLGHAAEGLEQLNLAAELLRGAGAERSAQAVLQFGHCALTAGDLAQADEQFGRAAAMLTELGDDCGALEALHGRGVVALAMGRVTEGLALAGQLHARSAELGSVIDQARAEGLLARVAALREDHVAALRRLGAAVELWRAVDGQVEVAEGLVAMGHVAIALGRRSLAVARFRTALAIFERFGLAAGVAEVRELLAAPNGPDPPTGQQSAHG